MAALLTRAALALVSVLVVVWLVGSLRSTTAYEEALALTAQIQFSGGQEGGFQQAQENIRRSRRFGPDTRALRVRALLLLAVGRQAAAAATAERLVRLEPENLDAWGILFEATRQADPSRSNEALRRARRLNPLAGRQVP